MHDFSVHHSFSTDGPACATPDPVPRQETAAPARGRKRILVMDDEALILEITARMLGSQGYEVASVQNGDAAVTQYRAAMDLGRPFDAVIFDLTVPTGMGGFEAFKAIRAFDPGVKAILSSGYSHEPVVLDYKRHGIAGVAPKPYKAKDLVGAVEGVLGGR